MKLAWATDVHFDFLADGAEIPFLDRVHHSGAEGLLLGGDISLASRLIDDLLTIGRESGMPVYFVLGNHDYYRGSIENVRQSLQWLGASRMTWLENAEPVTLDPGLGLVGEGGWGDAVLGDFATSDVVLNDYLHIWELKRHFSRETWRGSFGAGTALEKKLNELGAESAANLRPKLEKAAGDHSHVLILTHLPPFREACWHEGNISNDSWLPGFTCGALGRMIREVASERPDTLFTVLCGHTHSSGTAEILPNLAAHTLGADYGTPDFVLLDVAADKLEKLT
jgi:Icc protein